MFMMGSTPSWKWIMEDRFPALGRTKGIMKRKCVAHIEPLKIFIFERTPNLSQMRLGPSKCG